MPKKKPSKKKKTGRPSGYKKKYCQMLIDHMAQGYSIEAFAGEIGVTKKTIYNWVDLNEEFLHAQKVGQTKSQLWWEKAGRQGMFLKTFTPAIWIFSMKNRFNWTDKKESNSDKAIHTVTIQMPEKGTQETMTIKPKELVEE